MGSRCLSDVQKQLNSWMIAEALEGSAALEGTCSDMQVSSTSACMLRLVAVCLRHLRYLWRAIQAPWLRALHTVILALLSLGQLRTVVHW